ncbi:hypothetical protein [Lactococcus petauri]|uniref:hypothetical protein n=1 Tax=Lactococcus petauri TaxID=1940789 RepID=UPI0038542315
MNIDSTVTLPLVIAFAAIISPTITTLITVKYKLKELEKQSKLNFEILEKKTNIEYERADKLHRREIYENYLKYANAIEVSEDKYPEAYLLALVIAPPGAQELMKQFDAGYVQKSPILDRSLLLEISDIIEKEFNSLL